MGQANIFNNCTECTNRTINKLFYHFIYFLLICLNQFRSNCSHTEQEQIAINKKTIKNRPLNSGKKANGS